MTYGTSHLLIVCVCGGGAYYRGGGGSRKNKKILLCKGWGSLHEKIRIQGGGGGDVFVNST